MGKKIIRASKWSFLYVLNRILTLAFALFSVAAGFSATRTSANDSILKGKALNGIGSTVLGNIKLYLCDVSTPVYGMGYWPYFYPVDSTITDPQGNFEFAFPENLSSRWEVALVQNHSGRPQLDSVSAHIFRPDTFSLDSTLTAYLFPVIRTGVAEKSSAKGSVPLIKTMHGKTVSLKIGNWSSAEKYSARVLSINGELVAEPEISSEGVLTWNTQNAASGVYILNVRTKRELLKARITVK